MFKDSKRKSDSFLFKIFQKHPIQPQVGVIQRINCELQSIRLQELKKGKINKEV